MKHITGTWLEDASAQALLAALEARGHSAYFVGGCVRNAVLDLPVTDLDIATDARPEAVISVAKALGFKPVPTGIEHGTITVVGKTQPLEVTTFRKDVETDGRHAVVAFSDRLEDDAARRDFRMNALYADRRGALSDPTGGLDDIRARQIVFVGEAKQRIREDYLRIIRLYRFAAQLGFGAEGISEDASAASKLLSEGIGQVSVERQTAEMMKLLSASKPLDVLVKMSSDGVLQRVLPDVDLIVFKRFLEIEVKPNTLARLAALVPDRASLSLRLSKREHRLWEQIGAFADTDMTADEMAYRHGAEPALQGLTLRCALQGNTAPSLDQITALEAAEAQQFPLKAKDMPDLQGKALGDALRAAEARWIASGFGLTKQDLLR